MVSWIQVGHRTHLLSRGCKVTTCPLIEIITFLNPVLAAQGLPIHSSQSLHVLLVSSLHALPFDGERAKRLTRVWRPLLIQHSRTLSYRLLTTARKFSLIVSARIFSFLIMPVYLTPLIM